MEFIIDIQSLSQRDIEALGNQPKSLIEVTVIATAEAPVKTGIVEAGVYKFSISQLRNQQLVVEAVG